jgi:hypothetical protein
MYGILFDQTYINMVIFGLIVFFIMFLWRKLTVMEGNVFILEKRVDMMKKSDRKDSINKSFESADIVMNEIFKDSTVKNNYCNDVNYKCPIENIMQKNKKNTLDLSDIINKNSDMVDYINIINDIDNEIKEDPSDQLPKYIFENTKDTNITLAVPKVPKVTDVPKVPEVTEVTELKEVTELTNVTDIAHAMNVVQNTSVAQDSNLFNDNDQIDFDTVSVSSDITFGNDTDKTMTKKYKNMNVERLREECKDKSLNTEGTKAILISRILEYNKKQK